MPYGLPDPRSDSFGPPAIPVEVSCLHCGQAYDSCLSATPRERIAARPAHGDNGRVPGDHAMHKSLLVLALLLPGSAVLAEPLREIKVVNDRAPDCSSLRTIVESVTRGCRTDDEKVIAIYNFCRYVYYHHAYPSEEGGVSALKMIHVYGWGLCGGQHSVLAALWD